MTTKRPPKAGSADARWKILLLDDHPMVREALTLRIEREPDLTVCAAVGEANRVLPEVEKHHPDLAILDLSLASGHGLEVIKDIRASHPEVRMLVFSMHDESLYGGRVLHSGAQGYVMKHESPECVLHAIRRVLAGELAISPRLADKLLRATATRDDSAREMTERLSDRELEIFQLIGEGLGTKEIASRLQRGVKTIETFRARIKRKLDIASMSELIAQAAQWAATRRL